MTTAQEQQKLQEYFQRIAEGLRQGTEQGYEKLCSLCDEEDCLYLSSRNRELTLFRRIMRIWNIERGHATTDTIIGRTAAFLEESLTEVTLKQLIDTYTLLKFAIFRLESETTEELQLEGVFRVAALGLSAGAILLAIQYEANRQEETILRLAELMETPSICDPFPKATVTAAVLRGAMNNLHRQGDEPLPADKE